MPLTIRKEQKGDEAAVFDVNLRAFGREVEPKLVDALRTNCPEGLSLVAEQDGRLVGQILFTPAQIAGGPVPAAGLGLGPLAVIPEYQRRGIGSALVSAGVEELRETGALFVALVGHPEYYPKFGFEKASKYGLRCEFEKVPDEAFMILILNRRAFGGTRGVVRWRPEFAAAV